MKIFSRNNVIFIITLFILTATSAEVKSQAEKSLGIATYSVKGLETDIEGSFRSLQNDGYAVMEISNYNANNRTVAGYSPVEYAALVEKYGMDIISSHSRAKFDVNDVVGSLEAWGKIFDDHKDMGCKYVVLPMNTWSNTIEAVKAECDLMNKIGEEANKRGIKFGYHNHNFEFSKLGDTDYLIEDFLIENTDPDKVFFQMDVYWVTVGGQDPVAYLKKYPNRFQLLHIKDDYVIGESGNINYEAIFNQFYANGFKDWFVEIEEQMTEERKAQMQAMMEMMQQRQSPAGQKPAAQGEAPAQDNQADQSQQRAQANPPAGASQPDTQAQADRLRISLEAISKSAEYLRNASFVK